jgi:hypothetical protein
LTTRMPSSGASLALTYSMVGASSSRRRCSVRPALLGQAGAAFGGPPGPPGVVGAPQGDGDSQDRQPRRDERRGRGLCRWLGRHRAQDSGGCGGAGRGRGSGGRRHMAPCSRMSPVGPVGPYPFVIAAYLAWPYQRTAQPTRGDDRAGAACPRTSARRLLASDRACWWSFRAALRAGSVSLFLRASWTSHPSRMTMLSGGTSNRCARSAPSDVGHQAASID